MINKEEKKIHIIQMIVLSLIIIITAISIKPVLDETDKKMMQFKADLISSLENAINYQITYESVSPSIFSYISINNLIIYKDKQKTIKLAQIKSFKAFYSPFYFFGKRGKETPLQAVKRFVLSNSSFYVDSQRDQKLISFLTGENTEDSKITLFPIKTVFSGKNIDVMIKSDLGTFQAENLFFTMSPESDSYKTKIDGEISLDFENKNTLLNSVKSKVSIKGTLGEYFDTLNLIVNTKGLDANIFELKDQTFQIVSSNKEIQVRKVQDNSPIDLAMRYDRKLNDLVINFNAEKFYLDSILRLKDRLSVFVPYSSSEISGNGSLLLDVEEGTMVYSLNSSIIINRDVFNRDITLMTDLTGDSDQINIRSLDVKVKEGRFLFTGDVLTDSFFPSGFVTLKNVRTPNGYTINSLLQVERDSGFLYLSSDKVSLGNTSINAVDLVLLPENGYVSASLKAEISHPDKVPGIITADALFEYSEAFAISSYIKLNSLPMDKIVDLMPDRIRDFSIPGEVENTTLNSQIFISANQEKIDMQISDFKLISTDKPENLLSLTATYSDSGFKINDLYLNWNDYNLNGYVNSSREKDDYIITTHFDLQEKPYRIQAIYDGEQLLLEGDYNLYGFFQKDRDGFVNFKFSSDGFPVPYLNSPLYADLDLSGYFSANDWKVYINNTRITSDKFYTLSSPELLITAEADQFGCNFYKVQFNDTVSSLKGLGRMTYDDNDISSWLSLLDETGKTDEQYDLFFNMKNGVIESRASIISSPLKRIKENSLTGQVSIDFSFNGTPQNPDINAVFHTDKMNYNGIPWEISSFVRGDKDVIRISDMELNYNGIMLNRGLVLLEMNKGKLLATGAINQVVNNSKASTSITAMIKSDHSFDLYSINKLNASQLDGKITVSPILWDSYKTFPQLDIVLKKDRSLITARIDDGKILDSSFNIENGELTMAVKDLFPLRLTAGGYIRNSLINMEVENLYFDAGFINYFMPVDPFKEKRHVVFKGGSLTGGFLVNGQLSDPDFTGILKINDLLVESPYLAETPGATSTTAYLDGHTMTLDPLMVPLKNGKIEINSNFEFDRALPTTYNVDVLISGSSGARVAYEIPNFSWDGHFSGKAHIEGSKQGGFLKGNLVCNDLYTSLESRAKAGPVKIVNKNPSVNGFVVDLTIQTGRDVNFYLPNRKVPIIQATADYGDTLNIAYDSRSDVLALVGKIDIRTGEINYFNKTFYLQEGYIDFNESQVKFNPWLNVRADVVSKDELGDDVTVSLLFDDYLFNEFKPEFLSFPSKSENEILALLGQSFIPSNDPDNVSVASLLVATGGMIGKNTIMQPFEEAIKSSLNLDFVSFNTNIIENAILDRFQDQEFYKENRQAMNFARYLENTSLFVGEYIGDYLFLEGSLVVDYDESNSVSSTLGGLELNVNLNLQFITPFVLIDWTYNPKNNPGSEYFLPQNTISFTWQYSY